MINQTAAKRGMASLFSVAAVVLAACGATSPNGPGPSASPSGCKALQKDLKKYERKGVAGWAEAKNAGRRLSKKQEAGLRAYNELLNKYLGGQCHL